MGFSRGWFLAGLFLTTLVTLCIEVLFTRLLSVTLWYHLSFFAVSTAMFGMSAGALRVYLSDKAFDVRQTLGLLHRLALGFALVVPLSHVVLLVIMLPKKADVLSTLTLSVITVITVTLAIPFFLSGMLVTIALTRVPGRIGLTYAVDLVGAAMGTLLVLPLLNGSNVSTAFFLCGALAALGSLCFLRSGGLRFSWVAALAAVLLAWVGIHNLSAADPVRAWFPKGRTAPAGDETKEYWNVHSQITLLDVFSKGPHFWGPGKGSEAFKAPILNMTIDGAAGTSITKWDGDIANLEWAEYDVTSLPYHLRPGGDAAVIGVGGGRDVLTALRFHSKSVKGIEINQILIDLLENSKRDVAHICGRPDVELVHDEARSYLTRTKERFDVLQMSLIDTWASTGAGAMTLSENGLYTLEAWDVFLRVLKPGGLFSVSRWYDSANVSETSRLVALGVAALLQRGVTEPAKHMAMLGGGNAATLLVSPEPLAPDDLARIHEMVERYEFRLVLAPDHVPDDPQLAAIARSDSRAALDRATANERFDFTPPTDERPFFFNLLKLGSALEAPSWGESDGVVAGNLRATTTLAMLFVVSFLLVVGVILAPLISSGLPPMALGSFGLALWYFIAIGVGYMLVQIPSMQRFSVYLGHPVYAVVVILFSMILATGIGSYFSDRVPIDEHPRFVRALPLAIALMILLATLAIQPLIDATIGWNLIPRALVVVAWIGPVAFLLGFGFPLGMRLVRRVSPEALPWMWGVNGASSVFAAVLSVAVSMSFGTHANLYVAVLLYGTLALVAPALWKRGVGA